MRLQATIEINVASDVDCGPCYFWGAALCRLFGAPVNGHKRCAACRMAGFTVAPEADAEGLSSPGDPDDE